MRQGEIWYCSLNPVKGSEQAGHRPVVILSGDLMIKCLKVVIVCPLTTSVKNYKGNVVLKSNKANGLKKTSEVLVFHIRSVSKDRLTKCIGKISDSELDEMKKGLGEMLRY
ncbi:MAG: type II toxin-antitoxin system PemK/MazF family toxin [Cryomorphaceae bacterium]|nr:MAG: type II toxin-antitoxin system PemK/MazF family toxin [Cryomorphaceae bacterium]